MLQAPFPVEPHWLNGDPPKWDFSGIFENREDAEAQAVKTGSGFVARWGGYDDRNNEFVSGDS